MICCYHTKAKGQMCKEIIPIFLCVALLLSFTLPEIGDYTIRELIYGVQDTTTVVRGTRIACEIIVVSNPGYIVYTIYEYTEYSYQFFYKCLDRNVSILILAGFKHVCTFTCDNISRSAKSVF